MNMYSIDIHQIYTDISIWDETILPDLGIAYMLDTFTEVMPHHLHRRHPREEEHGAPRRLLICKETYYHKIVNKNSQTYMGDILG